MHGGTTVSEGLTIYSALKAPLVSFWARMQLSKEWTQSCVPFGKVSTMVVSAKGLDQPACVVASEVSLLHAGAIHRGKGALTEVSESRRMPS